MTQRLKFAFFILFAGAAAWFAPAARADEWDKQTVLTFNEPVEIPGQVLLAGTYVFKLLDSPSDRTIVQIFTEDQQHLLATVMAVPDYRVEPKGNTVVTFEERPAGSPEALHSWFYPGDNYGVEFVYPKSDQQYAAQSEQPAPAVAIAAAPKQEPKTEATGPVVMHEQEVAVVAQAMPAPTDYAPPAENESAPTSVPNMLPTTAGNFAMIPLLGMALISGGFAVIRFSAKQI